MKLIDLRSDTVTRPTKAMMKVMMDAPVGDDVFGEDPTINRLQELVAEMAGHEAAIFAPSGTQTNLMALMSFCERGDEFIVGQQAHTYLYEGGGAAVLGSIQPQPLDFESNGTLNLNKVAGLIKPGEDHFATTKLLCLENTTNGVALPMDYFEKASSFTKQHKLGLYLDGARIFNALVKRGAKLKDITSHFDAASLCLSKGLGAPGGSVLLGSKEFIKIAHKWRKLLGGGMRQVGILAAAGIYALGNNIERLAEDHENAQLLFDGLSQIEGLKVSYPESQTNMCFVEIAQDQVAPFVDFMKKTNIVLYPNKNLRLVTHLDVSKEDIMRVVAGFKNYFG
jgi:threonine aldolase